MNIIISNDKSIRLTQYSSQSTYNLDNINFYISKNLKVEDIYLNLIPPGTTTRYSFLLSEYQETPNYIVYKVEYTQSVSLSARAYSFEIILNDEPLDIIEDVSLKAISFNGMMRLMSMRTALSPTDIGMTDEHEPIEVNEQRMIVIANNQNVLVAEDNISQCITFKLKRYQDGIDLLDKNIYVDFISKDSENNSKLYNDLLSKDSVEEDGDYFTIAWVVPYTVTKNAGTVKFSISAVGTEEENYYIWQTQPSQLTILPNLHKRNETIVDPADELSIFANLQRDIDSIKTSDIYKLDTENDNEVILGGGGAPINEEG